MTGNTSTNHGFSAAMLDYTTVMGCFLDFFVAVDLGHGCILMSQEAFRATSLVNEQCGVTEPQQDNPCLLSKMNITILNHLSDLNCTYRSRVIG